jgi:geranylgeranylglycerol-phosphate geranylgeranyltransferase
MNSIDYIKILRPSNAAMAAGAVWLGAWISRSAIGAENISLLAAAAFFSTGFGNVINDILDRETDRISHPDRPLPSGRMSIGNASIYMILLATAALTASFSVAPLYGIATVIPLTALLLYARFLKGTPLVGNILVSLLVAYSLLFGSLAAPDLSSLFIPALCAMLLNLSREIIKDIQDTPGDRAAGIVTTAALPAALLQKILLVCSGIFAVVVYLPFFRGDFGIPYVLAVTAIAVPLHTFRITLVLKPDWTGKCAKISRLLKIEMVSGLAALAIDRLFTTLLK